MVTSVQTKVAPDLLCQLSQASHVLATEMTAALASLGVSPRAYCVLQHAMSGELTQTQLADACSLDKTTMVVTVDELEKAGLAERRPSSTDRRARIIAVTRAGQRIVTEAKEIVSGIYADVLAALPARERSGFADGLARLVDGRLSTPVACQRPVRRRT